MKPINTICGKSAELDSTNVDTTKVQMDNLVLQIQKEVLGILILDFLIFYLL
jgi:hypothetical protein